MFGFNFSSLSHSCSRLWILLMSPDLSLYFIHGQFHADHRNLPRAFQHTHEEIPFVKAPHCGLPCPSSDAHSVLPSQDTVWARVGQMLILLSNSGLSSATLCAWSDSKMRRWQETWPLLPVPPSPPGISLLHGHSTVLSGYPGMGILGWHSDDAGDDIEKSLQMAASRPPDSQGMWSSSEDLVLAGL